MTARNRRTGAALALTSVAAVGLAALGPGLPGEEGELAAYSATVPTTPAPSPVVTAREADTATASATASATGTGTGTGTATGSAPNATPTDAPVGDAGDAGEPAPVDVSHLPPPPVAASGTQAASASERRSRTEAGRIIQVRARDIRLLSNGRLLFEAPRAAGPVSLSRLVRYLGSPRWMARSGDVTTVKAAIYLSPGTHLTIGPTDAKTVRMEQTPSGFGGSIYGSGATLTVTGVDVTSWDPATGKPAAPNPRRPFISFNRDSTLRFTDATFTALGRPGSGQTGVALYDGREFVTVRTTFTGGVIGMASVRTDATRLDRVTARGNSGTGVLVRGRLAARSITTTSNAGPGMQVEASPRTDIWSVKAERNSGPGLAVRGSNVVELDALRANGNGGGLEVTRSSRVRVTDTVTTGNAGSGVDIAGANTVAVESLRSVQDGSGVAVRNGGSSVSVAQAAVYSPSEVGLRLGAKATSAKDLTVTGAPTGIVLDDGGSGASVETARVEGARAGLRVMAGNTGATVSGVDITPLADTPAGAARADTGADIGGHGTSLTDVNVDHATTGYVVRGGADDITLSGVSATDTETGVRVQEGVDGIVLRDVTVTGATSGLDSAASAIVVQSSRFTDVTTGAKFSGAATLTGVDVDAAECGIRSVGGTPQISGGTIRAVRHSCGDADLGDARQLPPESPRGLGLFAGAMVALAVAYESVRALRERRRRNGADNGKNSDKGDGKSDGKNDKASAAGASAKNGDSVSASERAERVETAESDASRSEVRA